MRGLRIASARLSVEGIRALASMPRLEALSLRDQDVPPGSFAILRSAPRLRFLDLDHARFDPSELRPFDESATLDFLSLNDTSVADRHVDLLARLMVTKLSPRPNARDDASRRRDSAGCHRLGIPADVSSDSP